MRETPAKVPVGTVIDGRYRIESVAGEGGFGVVYRAQHLAFDVPIALKMLKLRDDYDPATRDRRIAEFRREGQLLFRLSSMHPAFVQAKESGTYLTRQGTVVPYLVLEWLDGVPLSKELHRRREERTKPFSIDEVVQLLDFAATGLFVAHQNGVAHADLKPGNLFVTERDGGVAVRILDFGLARVVENVLATAAVSSDSASPKAFTPAYGAPEQWLSRLGKSGTWTDVHALALVCVELLRGSPALSGADSAQLMGACLDSIRPTPLRVGVTVTPEVEAVFARALSLSPRDRYSDLPAFWRELKRASGAPSDSLSASHLVSTLDGPRVPQAFGVPASATAPTVTNGVENGHRVTGAPLERRRRWPVVVAVVAASVGAASLSLPSTRILRVPEAVSFPAPVSEPAPAPSVLSTEVSSGGAFPEPAQRFAAPRADRRRQVRASEISPASDRPAANPAQVRAVEPSSGEPAPQQPLPRPPPSESETIENLLRRDELSTRY
jgi:serine/threonine protein kinase